VSSVAKDQPIEGEGLFLFFLENMKVLHPWKVNVEEAIQIQENLRNCITLEKTFTEVRTIGGGDVAYSKDRNFLFAAIVVLSFPKTETMDFATAHGEIPFPYIPCLLIVSP